MFLEPEWKWQWTGQKSTQICFPGSDYPSASTFVSFSLLAVISVSNHVSPFPPVLSNLSMTCTSLCTSPCLLSLSLLFFSQLSLTPFPFLFWAASSVCLSVTSSQPISLNSAVCLSVCLSLPLFVCLSVYLSLSLSVSVCHFFSAYFSQFCCLSLPALPFLFHSLLSCCLCSLRPCPSFTPFLVTHSLSLSPCLSACLSLFLPVCLPVSLPLSLCLSVSVCLSHWFLALLWSWGCVWTSPSPSFSLSLWFQDCSLCLCQVDWRETKRKWHLSPRSDVHTRCCLSVPEYSALIPHSAQNSSE